MTSPPWEIKEKRQKQKQKKNHHVINQKLTFSPPPTINNASKKGPSPNLY